MLGLMFKKKTLSDFKKSRSRRLIVVPLDKTAILYFIGLVFIVVGAGKGVG